MWVGFGVEGWFLQLCSCIFSCISRSDGARFHNFTYIGSDHPRVMLWCEIFFYYFAYYCWHCVFSVGKPTEYVMRVTHVSWRPIMKAFNGRLLPALQTLRRLALNLFSPCTFAERYWFFSLCKGWNCASQIKVLSDDKYHRNLNAEIFYIEFIVFAKCYDVYIHMGITTFLIKTLNRDHTSHSWNAFWRVFEVDGKQTRVCCRWWRSERVRHV